MKIFKNHLKSTLFIPTLYQWIERTNQMFLWNKVKQWNQVWIASLKLQENNAQTTLCQKPFSFFFAVAKLFAHAKFKLQPVINYALLIHYCFRFFNLYVGHYNNKIPVWWRRQIKDKKNIDGHDLIVPVCRCACICLVNSGFKLHLEFTSRSRFLPIHDEEKGKDQ